MYLSSLKLWNFRKFGAPGEIDVNSPHLAVVFKRGLNVLVGENDSGKTAIIDAIKLVFKTHAFDWIRPSVDDFYEGATSLRIELIISDLTESEASHFIEWLGWNAGKPFVRVIYQARKKNGAILFNEVKAGETGDGIQMTAEAKSYFKTTYLRPLRDANNDLTSGRNSRLSQILEGHKLLQKKEDEQHELEEVAVKANNKTRGWFLSEEGGEASNKRQIIDVIDGFIHEFIDIGFFAKVSLVDPEIHTILEKLSLGINEDAHLGLGTMNRLYMAAELLHLKNPSPDHLNLCLVEELEAHLHPQSQLRVITALQKQKEVQFILTTHSPNITSQLRLSEEGIHLLMCKNKWVFPLSPGYTKLTKEDYCYLQTFLDVTKANLFFSKGVFLVEGWAEEIIIPVIAEKMGYNLVQKEVSMINVGSTAYLRFSHIFMPSSGISMGVKVAAITDLDVQPRDGVFNLDEEREELENKQTLFGAVDDPSIKLFCANQWTLEWCLYKSPVTKAIFMDSVAAVHSNTKEFKKNRIEGVIEDSYDEDAFTRKLIEKLGTESKNKLDKVAVAYQFANRLSAAAVTFETDDAYLSYLVNAINHVCK